MSRYMQCEVKQCSDQMVCVPCGLCWDVNDAVPPHCGRPGPEFTLRVLEGGDIRISREGQGQTVRHADLQRHGWNSIANACRLINDKIVGERG